MTLQDKTVFITGASRGIGQAMALRCAHAGANVVVTAKTVDAHPTLPGTIHSVAAQVEAIGSKSLAIQLDVRDEAAIAAAVTEATRVFGGIDVLINNASAIMLTHTADTPMKRYDLMQSVNARGTFACSQACLPWLTKSAAAGRNPHILNLSPPLSMKPKWFKDHVAYTMSKYGMSMCTLGMAEEFRALGIAVNSLWPRTTIATAAISVHFPEAVMRASRQPDIMADAAYEIFMRDSRTTTGNFFTDEEILRSAGVTDFAHYAVTPGATLHDDFFLD